MSQITNDMTQMKESLKLINNALNRASKAGVYNIDEAYLIKLAVGNMEKLIETYEVILKKQPTKSQPSIISDLTDTLGPN